MYHVKAELAKGVTLNVEIKDGENTYARCPVCGKEAKVDLADIFEDGDGLNGALYRPECWEGVRDTVIGGA
ncbi:MAG: hypothetical protein LBJ11_00705 [Oscillospiraceae bacterium]|jgi:hypothetical protein|nr:hypothetical protein [Oscillospiraceae bacterium]